MKEYRFKFSVIIPIYNVEDYLEEAIESIINQSIGFEENIQLILVNDGSIDNSEDICLKYKEMYPNNIKYIKQKNSGVSKARNNGLKYAEGKYINLLDSDDKWDLNAFLKAYNMFEQNQNLDMISVRIKFFEAEQRYHNLDYKFIKDCIIDLNSNYDYIHISSCAGFIRKTAIKNIKFDEKLKYAEDIKFVTEILLNNMKLGIISSALYYYRRRLKDNSAIQTKDFDKSWYFDTPKYCYLYLMNLSRKKHGYINKYVQFLIMHDYQWRFKEYKGNLTEEEYSNYLGLSKEIIDNIEDEIILEQRNLKKEHQIQILSFKYGYNIAREINLFRDSVYFKHTLICKDIFNSEYLTIDKIDVLGNEINIVGRIAFPIKNYNLYLTGKKKYYLQFKNQNDDKFLIKTYKITNSFNINIPSSEKNIYFKFDGSEKILPIYFSANCILTRSKYLFLIKDNKKFKFNNNHIIIKDNRFSIVDSIIAYLYIIKKEKLQGIKICLVRLLSFMYSIYNKKEVYLISSELQKEKYQKSTNRKIYYYSNNKNDKKYVYTRSLKYKILFLNANKIIDNYIYNPFGKQSKYYNGLLKYQFQKEEK